MHIIHLVFGSYRNLTWWQMASRGVLVFFITLLLIRISGMRSFGKKSAFDVIVGIMLGSVLSRVVVGVSPFLPTVASCLAMVAIHRIVALLCIHHGGLERLVKGQTRVLYREGEIIWPKMRRSGISHNDLMESVRLVNHSDNLQQVKEIRIESTGELSLINHPGKLLISYPITQQNPFETDGLDFPEGLIHYSSSMV